MLITVPTQSPNWYSVRLHRERKDEEAYLFFSPLRSSEDRKKEREMAIKPILLLDCYVTPWVEFTKGDTANCSNVNTS